MTRIFLDKLMLIGLCISSTLLAVSVVLAVYWGIISPKSQYQIHKYHSSGSVMDDSAHRDVRAALN